MYDNWNTIVSVDVLENTERIIGIREVSMINNIENDFSAFKNMICAKCCCICSPSDFEISLTELLEILHHINIKYNPKYVKKIFKQIKSNFSSPLCIFVDIADGNSKVYEICTIICRKYCFYEK
ncbi:MAG: hypothetical protein IJ583_00695 [Firmicutes bacterium]|nr:hypothetical protein [Bacillota bacterium]